MTAPQRDSELDITVRPHDCWIVVAIAGELDVGTADALSDQLDAAFTHTDGLPRLALDVAGLNFCDSSGLRVLITAWQQAQQRNGEFVLLQPPEPFVERLKTTGLHKIFTTRESLT